MTPTPEQLAKLPKWAQEHIKDLERELTSATTLVKKTLDTQTPSPFYVDDWSTNPSTKRYIQACANRVCMDWAGVHLEVMLAAPDDGQRLHGVELTYRGSYRMSGGEIAVMPRGISTIQLVTKENMR